MYHVYNRTGRGGHVFSERVEAERFVELLREITRRDEVTVFAWCLMSNHYHLALRTGPVSLDRPLRSLQQRVTRGINARARVYGSLWQSRYKAKLVNHQRYLDQLLMYIHLNPVDAGIVRDPALYPWSGHNELLGQVKDSIVDVDEVLRVFGNSRRSARAAYVRRLKGAIEEPWIGEQPGHLPWWRLGRPPKDEDEDPETAVRARRERQELGPVWRPGIEPEALVVFCGDHLGLDVADLRSRKKTLELVRGRELVMLVGVERYLLGVKELAMQLAKSPDGMTQAIARAAKRRTDDKAFRKVLNQLDRALAEACEKARNNGLA